MKRFALGLLSLGAYTSHAVAYEIETHGIFTSTGFNQSVLSPAVTGSMELYARLGFDRIDSKHPFDQFAQTPCTNGVTNSALDAYVDALGSWLVSPSVPPGSAERKFRCPTEFEKRSMPPKYSDRGPQSPDDLMLLGPTPWLRFEGWLMRGVIREDDLGQKYYSNPNNRPDKDPWNDQLRVLHHFYDPTTNTSGTLFTQSGLPWVLGLADNDNALNSQVPSPNRENHFSYADARRAQFYALTYKQASPVTAAASKEDSDIRINLWATTAYS